MDQENVDLVISSAAIERLVEYKSKIKQYYQLHTTGIIKHAYSVSILELSSISIGSFSGKEMELFIEFFYGILFYKQLDLMIVLLCFMR